MASADREQHAMNYHTEVCDEQGHFVNCSNPESYESTQTSVRCKPNCKRASPIKSLADAKRLKTGPSFRSSTSSLSSLSTETFTTRILTRKYLITKTGSKSLEIGVGINKDQACEILLSLSDNCKNRSVYFNYDVWKTFCANHDLLTEYFATGRTPLDESEFIIPLNLQGDFQLVCKEMHRKPALHFGGSGTSQGVSMMQSTYNTLKHLSECVGMVYQDLASKLHTIKERFDSYVEDLVEGADDNNFEDEQKALTYLLEIAHDDRDIIDAELLTCGISSILKAAQE